MNKDTTTRTTNKDTKAKTTKEDLKHVAAGAPPLKHDHPRRGRKWDY